MRSIKLPIKLYKRLKFQAKFSILITVLVILTVASVVALVSVLQRRAILEEVRKKAFGLTSVLAHSCVQAVLTDDYLFLQELIDSITDKADVVYAMILDQTGKVIVHSDTQDRGSRYTDERTMDAIKSPRPLLQSFRSPPSASLRTGQDSHHGQRMWDLSVPVLMMPGLKKVATARIGFSLESAYAEVARTRNRILLIGFTAALLGIAFAWFLARAVTQPLHVLVAASRRIGAGELTHRVHVDGQDEIGELASAFNRMSAELQKRREELDRKIHQLARLTNYNESILQSMNSGVITVNPEGRIVAFNESAERITGLRAHSARGCLFKAYLAPYTPLNIAIEEALSSGRIRTDSETELLRDERGERFLRFSTRLLNHTNGSESGGVLLLFTDITRLKHVEEEIRRAEKMAALGSTAASIAHEIKTPLTSVRTFTELLPRKFSSPEFRARFVNTVLPQVDRLSVFVDDLLDFGRVHKPRLRPTEVNAVVNEAFILLDEAFRERDIHVHQTLSSLPSIPADSEQLGQVVLNILRNAAEATPQGGTIEVGTRIAANEPEEGEVIQIIVSDTGCGIPESNLSHLFEPFFSTKPKGSGLGLAISYNIVRDHGGMIRVESQEGKGTTFTILLPAEQPDRPLSLVSDAC
jgi:two-component system sensor histidine kinase AtoS